MLLKRLLVDQYFWVTLKLVELDTHSSLPVRFQWVTEQKSCVILHPWKLTWHWKIGKSQFSIGNTSSNGGVSIVMLVFRGVLYITHWLIDSWFESIHLMIVWSLSKAASLANVEQQVLEQHREREREVSTAWRTESHKPITLFSIRFELIESS